MQTVVAAPHAAGYGVGDAFAVGFPAHLIAFGLHQGNECVAGVGAAHALVDGVHEPELPALTLGGGAVFSSAQSLRFRFLLRQDGQAVRRAELVRDGAQPCQCPRPLPQHSAAVEADAVHNEVRMDVFPVDVGGDQHLALRPRPRRERLCDLVRQLAGDRLVRGEGLHIVIPNWHGSTRRGVSWRT